MKKTLLTSTALLAASFSFASLIVVEPFNYTVDANIGGVAATGTGLTGNWQRTFTDGATAILRVYDATGTDAWATPSNYAFTPVGTRVGTPVDQGNSAAVNLASAGQINFDANGVYYYSYLLRYGSDNRSRVSFGSSATPDLMRVQGIVDGTLRVYAGGDFTAGAALAGNADYLVVGRITTSADGNDEHRIWVYGSGATITLSDPGTAGSYASHSAAITGTASMLQFSNVIDASYGEFRMGTSWESVTVVPEPSTYVAIAGLFAVGAVLLRRRMGKK